MRDLRAWLFRIVRNAAVSHRRRAGHDGAELVETLSVAAGPQEEAERREVIHETLETIAGLPPRQREALLSIAVQGRSQDEVAEELGVSRIAVRQLVHRARTSLRAAATAVAPLPLVSWAAGAAADESLNMRIASLITGTGGAGAAATFAKAGVVAGVAATAVSAPMVVERRPPEPPAAIEATAEPARTPRPARAAAPVEVAAEERPAAPVDREESEARDEPAREAGDGARSRRSAERDHGNEERDDGSRRRAEDDDGERHEEPQRTTAWRNTDDGQREETGRSDEAEDEERESDDDQSAGEVAQRDDGERDDGDDVDEHDAAAGIAVADLASAATTATSATTPTRPSPTSRTDIRPSPRRPAGVLKVSNATRSLEASCPERSSP